MRLFTALELPQPVQAHMADILSKLSARPDMRDGAAWTPIQNLHVTLKFIGDVPDERVPALSSSLATLPFAPMTFSINRFLVFPGQGPARVLAANVARDFAPLAELFDQIEAACQPLGVARAAREYKPHVTLARFRRPTLRLTAQKLIRMVDPSLLPAPTFTATQFTLFQSTLTPGGAIHTRLATFAARPGASGA